MVKDFLNHVRKNGFKGEEAGAGKKGGKKGKAKGKKSAATIEEPEQADGEEDDFAAMLASINTGDSD